MRKNVTLEEKTRAIQRGVSDALREHALMGRSVCVWRDNKVVWLAPAEILEELRNKETTSMNGTQEHHDR
jgi:hypothetical protein